eukprot:15456418-Alexandrium_andersonii.AAC.1
MEWSGRSRRHVGGHARGVEHITPEMLSWAKRPLLELWLPSNCPTVPTASLLNLKGNRPDKGTRASISGGGGGKGGTLQRKLSIRHCCSNR